MTTSHSWTPTTGEQFLTTAERSSPSPVIHLGLSLADWRYLYNSVYFSGEGERVKDFSLCTIATWIASNGNQTIAEFMSLLQRLSQCHPKHPEQRASGWRTCLQANLATTAELEREKRYAGQAVQPHLCAFCPSALLPFNPEGIQHQ